MAKKFRLLGLCFLTAAFLAACQTEEAGGHGDTQTVAEHQDGQVPVADSKEVKLNYASMINMQLRQDNLYYYTYEQEEDAELYQLVCYRQKGENQAEILYTYGDDVLMEASRVDAKGNWYNLYEQKKADTSLFFLEKLDSQGNTQFLSQAEGFVQVLQQEMILDSAVTQEGEFLVLTESGTLLFWDERGQESKRIDNVLGNEDAARWEEGFVDAGVSGLYIYQCEEDKAVLRKVDSTSQGLGVKSEIEIPSNLTPGERVFSDSSAWLKVYSSYEDAIYLVGRDKLWSYSMAGKELTELLEWNASYVNLKPDFIEQISMMNNKLVLLCYDVFQNVSSRVVIEQKPESDIPQKQTIVLGAINDRVFRDNFTSLLQEYNAQSKQYFIELRLYGEEDGRRSEAIEKMNLDLLQGKGPDLFNLSNHSIPDLVAKGVLENLRPYLEASENLKEEDLLQGAVQALEMNGGLYAMADSFTVSAQVSLDGYSENGGMSIEQCMQLVQDYPDAAPKAGAGRFGLLRMLICADMDRYMNRQEKSCSFESEEFIHLLKTVSGWKENETRIGDPQVAQYLYEKQSLMAGVSLSSMIDYLQITSAFGDFACISGWPNQEGEPKYQFLALNLFGIGSGSEQKEGAWDFIEYLLSDEHQDSVSAFPVKEKSFEAALSIGMEQTGSYNNPYSGEGEKGIQPVKEDQDSVRKIVNNMYYEDTGEIDNILWEETAAVFEGDKTAEDAAKIIQSRVLLYLNE